MHIKKIREINVTPVKPHTKSLVPVQEPGSNKETWEDVSKDFKEFFYKHDWPKLAPKYNLTEPSASKLTKAMIEKLLKGTQDATEKIERLEAAEKNLRCGMNPSEVRTHYRVKLELNLAKLFAYSSEFGKYRAEFAHLLKSDFTYYEGSEFITKPFYQVLRDGGWLPEAGPQAAEIRALTGATMAIEPAQSLHIVPNSK